MSEDEHWNQLVKLGIKNCYNYDYKLGCESSEPS